MKIAVILPAAGLGKRFQDSSASNDLKLAGRSKIELDLAGKPIFLHAIELFLNRPQVGQIILAVNPESIADFQFRWGDKLAFHGVTLVPGGTAERWETVLKALGSVKADCTHAAIHDAARPLASPQLIERVFTAAQRFPAVIPGAMVNATLKQVADDPAAGARDADPLDAILGGAGKPVAPVRRVVRTVDRTGMVEVQTPQVFELSLLRQAYQQIVSGKLSGAGITDDAGLVESLGQPVYVVEGESTNLKITRPGDLQLADAYLRTTQQRTQASLGKKRLFKDDDE